MDEIDIQTQETPVHQAFVEKPYEVRLRKMSDKQLQAELKPYLHKGKHSEKDVKWAVVLNILMDSYKTGRLGPYLR